MAQKFINWDNLEYVINQMQKFLIDHNRLDNHLDVIWEARERVTDKMKYGRGIDGCAYKSEDYKALNNASEKYQGTFVGVFEKNKEQDVQIKKNTEALEAHETRLSACEDSISVHETRLTGCEDSIKNHTDQLNTISADVALRPTNDEVKNFIADSERRILTGDKTGQINEAYDTILEISQWIESAGGSGPNAVDVIRINRKINDLRRILDELAHIDWDTNIWGGIPTQAPTEAPTEAATEAPSQAPTEAPSQAPTEAPSQTPTQPPSETPPEVPTVAPEEINISFSVRELDTDTGAMDLRIGPPYKLTDMSGTIDAYSSGNGEFDFTVPLDYDFNTTWMVSVKNMADIVPAIVAENYGGIDASIFASNPSEYRTVTINKDVDGIINVEDMIFACEWDGELITDWDSVLIKQCVGGSWDENGPQNISLYDTVQSGNLNVIVNRDNVDNIPSYSFVIDSGLPYILVRCYKTRNLMESVDVVQIFHIPYVCDGEKHDWNSHEPNDYHKQYWIRYGDVPIAANMSLRDSGVDMEVSHDTLNEALEDYLQ